MINRKLRGCKQEPKILLANNYQLVIILGIILVNMFMNLKILTYVY